MGEHRIVYLMAGVRFPYSPQKNTPEKRCSLFYRLQLHLFCTNDPDEDHDYCKEQQEVNEPTDDMSTEEPEEPEPKEDDSKRPKHMVLLTD